VNTVENVIKTSEFIDDIYFVREKGGRSKESIVYQRENVERRSGGKSGTIPSWRWKFISSAPVPPSPSTSSSNKSREDA